MSWRGWTRQTGRALGAGIGGLLLAAAVVAEPPARDPVPLPIVAPGHLLVFQPSPTSTRSLEPGHVEARFELSESSVLHPPDEPVGAFETVADLEISRFQIAFDLGLTERWKVGVEVPFFYFHSGFLDHAIYEAESLFGKLTPRRKDEIQDEFTYLATLDGRTLIRGFKDDIGLGDVAFTAQRLLRRDGKERPSIALRAALKLPTSDDEAGFGGEAADAAIGVVLDWNRGAWAFSGGLNASVPLEQSSQLPGLHALPMLSGWAEVNRSLGRRLAVHLQVAGATQPFEADERLGAPLVEDENRTFTGHVLQFTPALSWRHDSGQTLYFGVVEDFLTSKDTASDVTVFFALRLPVRARLF